VPCSDIPPLHCMTPWSVTATFGEETGEPVALAATPTGADPHEGVGAELHRHPRLFLREGHHRPPGSVPAADGAPARAASSATSRRSASSDRVRSMGSP